MSNTSRSIQSAPCQSGTADGSVGSGSFTHALTNRRSAVVVFVRT